MSAQRRALRGAVLLLCVGAAACGTPSHRPKAGGSPSTSPSSAAPTGAGSPRILEESQLRDLVIPMPTGFAPCTTAPQSGPISPSDFEHIQGPTGAIAFHFVTGYQCSRSTSSDSETLRVEFYEFSTNSDAKDWSQVYISEIVGQTPSDQSSFPLIPGAVALNSQEPVEDTAYVHAVIAVANNIVMAVSYANDRAGSLPVTYGVWAARQYAQL